MRRTRRVLLFLVAGALLNVAVAWICAAAMLPVLTGDGFYHNPRGDFPLVVTGWRHLGREQVGGVGRSGTLLDREPHLVKPYAGDVWWPREAVTETMLPAYAVAAGWPMLTVSAWRTTDSETDEAKLNLRYIPVFHWGVGIPSGDWHIILPLRPMWRGMIVNSLLYAAVLWALVAGATALKRRRRRRRGLCPACAYPMGAGVICPECGIALPTDRRADDPGSAAGRGPNRRRPTGARPGGLSKSENLV